MRRIGSAAGLLFLIQLDLSALFEITTLLEHMWEIIVRLEMEISLWRASIWLFLPTKNWHNKYNFFA
jgi:hypothetical protein